MDTPPVRGGAITDWPAVHSLQERARDTDGGYDRFEAVLAAEASRPRQAEKQLRAWHLRSVPRTRDELLAARRCGRNG